MTELLGPSHLGPAGYQVAEVWARARGATLEFVDNARRYWTLGDGFGLRPEVLYAQSAKETGFGKFGGVLSEDFFNPAGIKIARPQDAPWPAGTPEDVKARGTDYNPNSHERWSSWDEGIRQHYNHLSGYVWGADGLVFGTPAGRRAVVTRLSWAGTVRSVEDMWRWAGRPEYSVSLRDAYLSHLMMYAPPADGQLRR